MITYVLSSPAEADLQGIWDFIAERSVDQADRVLLKIREEIRGLVDFPGKGHSRDDIGEPSLRFWSVYSYMIVYRVSGEFLEVIRVVHGARDLPSILHD